jgi:hypothetical protein
VGSPLAGATPATPEHSGRGGLFGRMGRHRRNSSSQASLVSLASIGRNESLGGPETPLRRECSYPSCCSTVRRPRCQYYWIYTGGCPRCPFLLLSISMCMVATLSDQMPGPAPSFLLSLPMKALPPLQRWVLYCN